MLDPAISDWPVDEALTFAKLALKCVELRRKDRPDLGKVVLPLLEKLRILGEEKLSFSPFFAAPTQNRSHNDSQVSVSQIVKAFQNPDFFTVVFPTLLDMCNKETRVTSNEKTLASNVKAEEDEQDNFSASHGCFTSIIHVARVSDIVEQETQLVSVVVFSLGPAFQWNVKMLVFTLLKEIYSRLHYISPESHDPSLHARAGAFVHELFHKVTPRVIECIHIIKIGQVHVATSVCILDLLVLYKDAETQHREVGLKNELQHLSDIEKNEEAKSLLRKCVTTLESFEG